MASGRAAPFPLAVLVTAAGRSERFGGTKKEYARLEGGSVLDRAVSAFIGLPGLEALVVTAPPGGEDEARSSLSAATFSALEARLGPRFAVVAGGATRRDSVRLGLEALDAALGRALGRAHGEAVVLIHDGARPWLGAELAGRVALIAAERGACLPLLPLVDTPKETREDGTVVRHPLRSAMSGAQTPQGFRLSGILEAHRRAEAEGIDCTDDAELWDRYLGPVASTPGEASNKKITFLEDLGGQGLGAARPVGALPFRVGQGWDSHRLVAGRRLLLGGALIPSDKGEEGHSDGDALLHAIIDALLGAAALGDIGSLFPPDDERWRGADSRELARSAAAAVRRAGWEPGNVDCTVVLERPRLGPHREAMRASIAAALDIDPASVSVKAKTKEGLDAAGEGLAVEAQAIVSLFPR